ncbi:MAG: hypothetical protein E7384_02035 [Ruminococcaceae bacterium]|nr:hypothetical protein [Oscillospiraceae bacterium]
MTNPEKNSNDYYVVDLLHILRTLWHRAWIIVLTGLIAAAIGFCTAAYLITPKYSSSVMLYVNNSSFSLGNTSFSISSSEITAAQSLVKTYSELLDNRTTLERVAEKAGVSYSYRELSDMIDAYPSNDTEIMKVKVTTDDPNKSAKIANSIAEVLPVRISEIIDGASMEVVDYAVPVTDKVSPSITKYTAIGLAVGVLLTVIVLVIVAIGDDTIHGEEYVLETYEYPILAKIPDLLGSGSKRYEYYSQPQSKKIDGK